MENQPVRGVDGQIVFSEAMPALRVEVNPALKYIGNLKFILYDAAWVDINYFAEGDHGHLKRAFHVQFEGYLPNNTHSYHYPSPLRKQLGEHEYIYDAVYRNYCEVVRQRPESDMARGWALLAEHGFDMDNVTLAMNERYVRLLDDEKRNEVLFVYTEILDTYSVDDLDNGRLEQDWPTILLPGLQARAAEAFRIISG